MEVDRCYGGIGRGGPPAFPRLRWVALVWLAVWLPAYWKVWGPANFLHLCDIAVILTCVGLWRGSSLLLSSQALSSVLGDVLWCADAASRLVAGAHLLGGTEYLWDRRYPLAVRLLSLFHVVLPLVLIWSLRRVGYDRRGFKLQSAIAAVILPLSRFVRPDLNINFALQDPLFGRSWGPAPVHLALSYLALLAVFYWPLHWILGRFLSPRAAARGSGAVRFIS